MYILPMLTHLEVVALGDRSDISPDQHLNYASNTRVWKSGRSVAETRTRSAFWVYMTYRDLVMAALSCWWLVCGF